MTDAENAFKKEGQTCCFCIPIQSGMKVMAILSIIGAVLTIIRGVVLVSKVPGNGIAYLLLSLLPLVVSWQWFMWLKEDTPESTGNLVKWMRLQFFINSVLQIVVGIMICIGVFEPGCPETLST